MNAQLLALELRLPEDVVRARQRARQLAERLGFDRQDQVRLATAVSEIARNAVMYAGGGRVEYALEGRTPPQVLAVRIVDRGPGIVELPAILAGRYRSTTGMGIGIQGARRLVDQFQIESVPGKGTEVTLRRLLPASAGVVAGADVARVAETLAREPLPGPAAELQRQNQELLAVLDDLRRRQDDLLRLNQELEDTNRGVLALYAELDEKADHLRRADEMKSRFLSNMSHEFRTPLNSILALSRLLVERADGDLTPEQERQVGFVRKAAEDLSELVNDLLDLAKVEAGKIVVRPVEFEARKLLGALRGMLRPLLVGESVRLVFEEPDADVGALFGDEAKVSQILRNFLSNSLKFTERGEIRVSAARDAERDEVVFTVADTGIGIAPEDQERIFHEFAQVEHGLQRRVKGTGLGLALSRRLAELLGGRITLRSTPGEGSAFALHVPRVYRGEEPAEPAAAPAPAPSSQAHRGPKVLVVEDSEATLHVYRRHFEGSPFVIVTARSAREALQRVRDHRPVAVVLDIVLDGEPVWNLLVELKRRDDTREVPVLVVSNVDDGAKATALGADGYAAQPVERGWLLAELERRTGIRSRRLLIVDDDPGARYVLRQLATQSGLVPVETESAGEGLRRARTEGPDAVVMDLRLPDGDGITAIGRLREAPETRATPIVLVTSMDVPDADRERLAALGVPVLSKRSWAEEGALERFRAALDAAGLATEVRA